MRVFVLGSHGQLWGFSSICFPLRYAYFTVHEPARPFVIIRNLVSLPFPARCGRARWLACLCALPPASSPTPPSCCVPSALAAIGLIVSRPFLFSYFDEDIPGAVSKILHVEKSFGKRRGPEKPEDPSNKFRKILDMGSIFSRKHELEILGNLAYG